MADDWAKMDARLDSHPKIRRGGRDAREVFLFALRRRRLRNGGGGDGRLPAVDFEAWYLADQLMMPEADAARGLARAIEVGLLARDVDSVLICGFDEEWGGRAPLSKAEKQRNYREREKQKRSGHALPTVTTAGNAVTDRSEPRNESNALPRSEERRSDLSDRERDARAGAGEPGLDQHRTWTLGLRVRRHQLVTELRAAGVGADLPPPSLVVDARVEVQALRLVQRWAAVAAAQGADPETVIHERGEHLLAVLVAQARARGSLAGLREETCWSPEVVGWAESTTPEAAAAAPDRRGRGGRAAAQRAIGPARPRNDHPVGAELRDFE